MRFPRHHKVFRGQLDVAPFAGVFFILVIFLTFHGGLVLTPGIELKLPVVSDLAGLTNQVIVVSVTENGSFFFENQITSDRELGTKFRALSKAAAPLTLVLQADGGLRHSNLVSLLLIAREAGIRETLIAVRPQLQPTVPPGAFGTRSVP